MRIAKAGETANPGLWIDPRTFRIHLQERGDGPLPGTDRTRWVRMPILLWIVAGPLIGFVYVVFLPVAGCVLAAKEMAIKISALARREAPRRGKASSSR